MRSTRGVSALLGAGCALLASGALSASRARYGGNLKVALAQPHVEADPLLADAPEQASISELVNAPLCRVTAQGVVPVLAQELRWTSPTALLVKLRPGLMTAAGTPLSARDVALALQRTAESATRSVYRGLLLPLRGQGDALTGAAVSADTLVLPLAYPFPEFLASLCHPALAPTVSTRWERSGVGPYRVTHNAGLYAPVSGFPEGRPFPERLQLTASEARAAERTYTLRQAQLLLGGGGEVRPDAPALFATYLVFRPEAVGPDFRTAVEASIDRSQLVETFVPRPSVAMAALLPPALGVFEAAARPSRIGTLQLRPFTLAYDASLEPARAVAERLQLKLHDRGYPVTLQAIPHADVHLRWATRTYEALLTSVLLPPSPTAAFGVVLELAQRPDIAARELPGLGGRPEALAERLAALRSTLPLIPLYAQGARVQADATVLGLGFDAQGLIRLDQLFLTPGPSPEN